MQTNNSFLNNLYSIRNNALTMLTKRGYKEWVNKHYANATFTEFEKLYKTNMIDVYAYKTVDDKLYQCIVYFVDPSSKMGKFKQMFEKEMQKIEQTFDPKADVITVIMIADNKSDNLNMSSIEKYVTKYPQSYEYKKDQKHELFMELFYYKEMIINITEHYLCPKQVLIGEEEVKDVLKRYKCNKDQLPRMLRKDAIAKYYGAKIGDVFKIYRKDPTSGISVHYRIVVDG